MNNHQNENMPHWAQRIDEYGKRTWPGKKAGRNRNGEYVGNIIFNIIFLWIVNHVPVWNLPFIKDSYMVVLFILNVNILIQIGGNILKLLLGTPVIRYLSGIITESASLVTQLTLFYIFPFDFSHVHGFFWLDWFVPIVLIFGSVISGIKVISNFWKLIFWRS